jgi:glycosyltransferase involved in cell wall biosynthesis
VTKQGQARLFYIPAGLTQAPAQAMAYHPAHLLIVGDGTERARLTRLCQELGISDRSHFSGFITAEQGLPDIYRLAAVFVTASKIETQGLVLLEAASCGLPIVGVKATCVPELVHDGVNGWMALLGDLDGLSTCINCLLNNPPQAQLMGIAGSLIAQEITLQKTIKDTEALYRWVI